MGLCKTSNVSIFTFINASDLEFAHVLTAAVWFQWKNLQNDDVTLWNSIMLVTEVNRVYSFRSVK